LKNTLTAFAQETVYKNYEVPSLASLFSKLPQTKNLQIFRLRGFKTCGPRYRNLEPNYAGLDVFRRRLRVEGEYSMLKVRGRYMLPQLAFSMIGSGAALFSSLNVQ
jgi:hypothetical protein